MLKQIRRSHGIKHTRNEIENANNIQISDHAKINDDKPKSNDGNELWKRTQNQYLNENARKSKVNNENERTFFKRTS